MISVLPPVQAALNLIAACLAGTAWIMVRKGNSTAHRALMIAALCVSSLFLAFYLYYHYRIGYIPFAGQGSIRPVYFFILASHVILAALMVPMILMTVTHALRGCFHRHRRIARWTLPIWVYVSVTGVLIYLLAFQIYPPLPESMGK